MADKIGTDEYGEMARKQGVTEQLKAVDMMRWVGLMNNIRACADEIVLNDIVYGVYGLLGVNGAGKTTLMRMICTLLTPTSGQILCDGKDIFKMDGEYRNLLGYLPQEFGFYPDFTVKDYLLYIASLKGIRPMVAGKRVKDLLAQVGLTKSANKKMKKLSGGMKRRAGIAQAMLNNPKILILDEPTAGLDPTERVRFRNLISELCQVSFPMNLVGNQIPYFSQQNTEGIGEREQRSWQDLSLYQLFTLL